MTAVHIIGQGGRGATPAAVVAWRGLRRAPQAPRVSDWIEATMARVELPGAVDLAKRPDTARRLSRLLGL